MSRASDSPGSSDRSTEEVSRWVVPLLLLSVILSFVLAILISVATTYVLSELRHQRDQIEEIRRLQSTRQQLSDNRAAEFRARLEALEEDNATKGR